jgi:hypothetical protein
MNKTFTYKDTATILGIGTLIFIIGMLGSLFLSSLTIFFVGLSITFSNRVKNLEERLKEIDKASKEVSK